MLKIGVISDTHGVFDELLRDFLKDVDEIWHAGDFGNIETADAIKNFKPLIGVRGNIDGGILRCEYPDNQVFTCENTRILIKHIVGTPGRYGLDVWALIKAHKPKILIAGHSHILRVQWDSQNDLLYINPGAAGISGFHKVRTAVRFVLDNGVPKELEVGEWLR